MPIGLLFWSFNMSLIVSLFSLVYRCDSILTGSCIQSKKELLEVLMKQQPLKS